MVKVSKQQEREIIEQMRRGASLSMLDVVIEHELEALTDSGESKEDAQEYLTELANRYLE